MEHVEEFVVVPVEMGWSDIGDWNGFAELIDADLDENCFKGQCGFRELHQLRRLVRDKPNQWRW